MNWKSFGIGLAVGSVGMLAISIVGKRADDEIDMAVSQKFIREAEERGTKMTCKILRHGLDGRKAAAEWVLEWQEAMECRADWKF